mmetsp:Transcript_62724/g.176897  ORF Transcript_62724/g.176897 Transcript_62724/m.176897 type:complete len:274 (+) Transcript_62724:76-897(+)|eukprot:CAMPEP_0179258812 /NCGR_PEP_ID=MMETSP0797-20121207/25506_1 /TAXON_ID=47934 /ORGANISM="Dinophysis acuminata, Strain DAEP01" /LENGTH=273 /DNA_ID=CAMNT_0020966851 /DNA_START=73 /DNA_END=891 /DNA_ORIENTATION=+
MAPQAYFRGNLESVIPKISKGSHLAQVLAGPVIMAAIALLQLVKKMQTGSHDDKLYQHIWKFVSKAEARDKVGRMVQYACRSIQGFATHMPGNERLQSIKTVVAEVQTTLAWARRTHRWMKEWPHVPVLGKALETGDVLEATQRAILITFLVQDHIYWLLKVGILKFENYTAIQWHRRNLRFITASHVFNFALCVRDIMRIRQKQALKDKKYSGTKEAEEKAEQDVYDNQRMMVRYVLTFVQMLHVSQVKQFDDWYVGIMGVVSSYIDASKQW